MRPSRALRAAAVRTAPFSLPNLRRFAVATLVPRLLGSPAPPLQQALAQRWQAPTEPLDPATTERFFARLAAFATGQRPLPVPAVALLAELAAAGAVRPAAPLHTRPGMWALLVAAGHVAAGDNLHRVAAAHRIDLPREAHMFAADHAAVAHDPFDPLRQEVHAAAYAIDSATTSEVDDAIAVEPDPGGGPPAFVVLVADATVHCPLGSDLERHSARLLATTTYLPESVHFMLPRSVADAATLAEGRRCRTFNVRFRIDPDSGALEDLSVAVGWCSTLRRITYDAVQSIYDAPYAAASSSSAAAAAASRPAWVTSGDEEALRTILRFARVRASQRAARSAAVSGSLPDPLVVVEGGVVADVRDQVVCTRDARLAVAELMIAANEACSRLAQRHRVRIPFRGSRPPSTLHEAAALRPPPPGRRLPPPGSAAAASFGCAVQASLEQLRGVTRALYHPAPLLHTGLDTTDYCHSTSPLRRYADMLVHHQLKAFLARSVGRPLLPFVPEAQLTSLCEHCSSQQARGKLLQQASTRYWILCFLRDRMLQPGRGVFEADGTLRCVVGVTEDFSATAATRRPDPVRTGVYVPAVQLVHHLWHRDPSLAPGDVLYCRPARIVPEDDALDLRVCRVVRGGDGDDALLRDVVPLGADDG